MRRYRMQIVLAAILITCGAARAEDWPARPITLVVPYGAGGPTDVIGRLFAQQMSERLGRQIIVENVPGAGGMTGANRVANAPPDGYQVLFGGSGNLVFNQILYKKPLFNSVTDFTPVALLTEQSLVLMARKDLPGEGLQDFMRHVKASKTASFGSSGAGSSTHLGLRDAQPCHRSGRHARAVPRQRAGDAGPDWRSHRLLLRHHPDGAAAGASRRRQGNRDPFAYALADAS